MTEIISENRKLDQIKCPKCREKIKYSVINTDVLDKFFYCNSCNNILSFYLSNLSIPMNITSDISTSDIERIWSAIELPKYACPCGGAFEIWSNVKCPKCKFEIPYNNNVKNIPLRFFESKMIWVVGYLVISKGRTSRLEGE